MEYILPPFEPVEPVTIEPAEDEAAVELRRLLSNA